MIQLVDLDKQYSTIKNEVLKKIEEVIESKKFIQGHYAEEFEKAFSKLLNVTYAAGCSNGTSAIALALEALGIKSGDEVITTCHTFIATAEAICHVGAKPVFVDIDPETYNINIDLIEKAITPKTKAIIPVHLYGNPADMDAIMSIAKKHGLKVVEDCAQAHLAEYNGKKVGSIGDAGTFSFYPGKNLGAYGDAGAVISNSESVINQVKKLLDHGRDKKYSHDIIGYNHRMDGMQAGILSVKAKYLEDWTKNRQNNAKLYNELLSSNPKIKTPIVQKNSTHVYHLYVIRVNDRDQVLEHLKDKGIGASIHYPIPLHLQPAFNYLGYKPGDFPETEKAAKEIVSLPMYPELSQDDISYICGELNKSIK